MPQKICKFKAKDSEIKSHPLCLRNSSKDFTANNMKKNKGYANMSTIFLLIMLLIIVIL